MRKRLYILIGLLMAVAIARGQYTVSTDSVRLVRGVDGVQLTMTVALGDGGLSRRDVVVVTPRLVAGADSLDFSPVVVFGRDAYYHDVRQGTLTADIPADAFRLRYKGAPLQEQYVRTLAHQPWMDHSQLRLIVSQGTPCGLRCLSDSVAATLDYRPTTVTVDTLPTVPRHAEFTDTISGQARIQFVVNKTDFNPDLANNRAELERMRAGIDSVRNNPDVGAVCYRIKGYASPEGSYDNNVRLAQGRTEQLRQYIVDKWGVPAGQLQTESVAEDWQGFRRYMTEHRSEYADADAIIHIIDTPDPDPDHKLRVIAQQHPQSYRRILNECFPALRRTDYDIYYERTRRVTLPPEQATPPSGGKVAPEEEPELLPDILTTVRPTRPWVAVKSNLLFDLALAPNVEVEVPIDRFSLMAEYWNPWYVWHHNSRAYEIQLFGLEARYWPSPRCADVRPTLTGTFVGAYYANGKYDIEWSSTGDQGEFNSVGLTFGHAWPLARHWNIEASVSAGYFWGPRRHYNGEFDDTHLIWKYTGKTSYFGPTKLKLSLVWLIPALKKKGGRP